MAVDDETRGKTEQQRIKDAVNQESQRAVDLQKNAEQAVPPFPSPVSEVPAPLGGDQNVSGSAPSGNSQSTNSGQYAGMEPSMLAQEQQGRQEAQQAPPVDQGYQQTMQQDLGGSGGAYESGYPEYQPYQEAMSSDMITEISEQVVSEKLAVLHDQLEKAIDFRNTAETRIVNLDERMRRIEQILDRLQLSLLQKVGQYVNDVSDIKKEMRETQKSFKALVPGVKKVSGKKGNEIP